MNYTTHYRLQKDLTVEKYDVNVVNMNSDIIDSALHRLDLKNESQDELLATKESLNSEITRATSKENDIIDDLTSEISRAKSAENANSDNISEEVTRALLAEETINMSLQEHISDELNPHNTTKEQLELGNVDNTSDINKPVSTAQQNAIDLALSQCNYYTDNKISNLIGGAPETMDTLEEVADAIAKHNDVVTALDAAIGKKADAAEVDAHTKNGTIHVTASERATWNNKLDKTGDASNVTNTFTASGTLTGLASKEKLSVSMGKLAKAVSTLISHIATTATASVAGHVKVDTALSAISTNPVQNKVVQAKIESLQSSFQVGCDALYNKCVSCGATPSAKTPAAIAAAIQLIQSNAVTAGKNSIKVSVYKENSTFTLNKAYKILITNLPNNTRRIIGYFIVNGSVEATSGVAAFLCDLTTPIVNGTTESFVELYMHPSNGTKIWENSLPITVKKEVTQVTGLGERTITTVSGTIYETVEWLGTDEKWDSASHKDCFIKGSHWPAQTATRSRDIIVIYETE